jgi:hypothetical protein
MSGATRELDELARWCDGLEQGPTTSKVHCDDACGDLLDIVVN